MELREGDRVEHPNNPEWSIGISPEEGIPPYCH